MQGLGSNVVGQVLPLAPNSVSSQEAKKVFLELQIYIQMHGGYAAFLMFCWA